MRIGAIGSGIVHRITSVGPAFAANTTPPDDNVPVPHSPGPERFFRLLFLRWYPRGKNRPGLATEEEIESWIDGFLPEDTAAEKREAFFYQVRPLGWRLIGLLNRFGVKVDLLSDDEYEGRSGHSYGKYHGRYKLIQIRDTALFQTDRSTVIHEFGHAIDHLFSSLCNGGHQMSIKLWHWFGSQREGFVTDYASTKPAEYLAESLEAYFLHHSYEELQRLDPAMYTFVDDLITISNA